MFAQLPGRHERIQLNFSCTAVEPGDRILFSPAVLQDLHGKLKGIRVTPLRATLQPGDRIRFFSCRPELISRHRKGAFPDVPAV
ncbi:MAG TPA: hypothetical protein VFE22_09185, partial [Edaphobacter sp.]|nr:hypothetical protein [Edaphobacter sp.]